MRRNDRVWRCYFAGFLVPLNPFDGVAVRFDVAFFQVSLRTNTEMQVLVEPAVILATMALTAWPGDTARALVHPAGCKCPVKTEAG